MNMIVYYYNNDTSSLPSLIVATNYSINEYNLIFKGRKVCLCSYLDKFTLDTRKIVIDFGNPLSRDAGIIPIL